MFTVKPGSAAFGNVQKSSSSKATASLTRGAYTQYVSTAKWRERRWRLFSTLPMFEHTVCILLRFKLLNILIIVLAMMFSSSIVRIDPSWAQNQEEEDIEMLDIIEVPGTAVAREPRALTFPSPDITDMRPFPDQDLFHIPVELQIARPVSQPTIMMDPIGKTRGIRSPVQPLKAERPPYPRFAREQGWQGTAVLRITIEADGTVSSATTRKSSGFPLLDESAIQSVEQWIFAPAKNGAFAVASTVDLPIRFDLNTQK